MGRSTQRLRRSRYAQDLNTHAADDLALLVEAVERLGRRLHSMDACNEHEELMHEVDGAIREDLPWLRERGLIW